MTQNTDENIPEYWISVVLRAGYDGLFIHTRSGTTISYEFNAIINKVTPYFCVCIKK